MTNSYTNDVPAETLRRIIQQYGLAICDDPRRCEALLKDLCGTYKREIHLLIGAQYENVPAELQRGLPLDLQRPRLVQQLSDDRGFDDELAEWAVNAWAYALGLVRQPPAQIRSKTGPQGVAQQPPPQQSVPPPMNPPVQAYTPPAPLPRPARSMPRAVNPIDPTPADDFDVVDDGSGAGGRRRSNAWMWLLVVFCIIFLAFASGMAIMTMMNRRGTASTIPAGGALHTPTRTGATAVALQGTPTVTAKTSPTTTTATPTQTATATQTPTATPQVACAQGVAQELAPLYNRDALGCAVAGPNVVWSAWRVFERGAMLWRSDSDLAYAFFNDGQWTQINEHWDGKEIPSRGNPPPGLQAPDRGFGYVWAIRDDLFQRLGWAKDQEKGFCALVQPFEKGFVIQSSPVDACTPDNLYNHARDGDWTPIFFTATDGGVWRSTGSAVAVPVATQPPAPPPQPATASQNPQTRPPENGVFEAGQAGAIKLDASFSDWPDRWTAIGTLVQGADNYSGSRDLSGDFQAAWSPAGLFLAVRVTDDKYRGGPDGTEMWKGDALEIHFDRLLAADYANTKADDDDYQLGVSFGPKLKEIRVYRWLPPQREGEFSVEGAVKDTDHGYQTELLLPWALFDQDGAVVSPGQTFGFNISISDNDGKAPEQQSVLSAAPKRTTYDNPTEWGTLIIRG